MFREIIAEIDRQIAAYRDVGDGRYIGIMLDAPLLFEAGLDTRCDLVLVIVADEKVRIQLSLIHI